MKKNADALCLLKIPALPSTYSFRTHFFGVCEAEILLEFCWPTVHKEITFGQHRSLVFVEPILLTTENRSGGDWILTARTTGGLTLQDLVLEHRQHPVLGTAKDSSVITLHSSCLIKANA